MIANPETIAYLRALTDDESEYQRDILQAREYDAGQQFIALTDRLRLFLGGDTANTSEDWRRLRLNVCRIVLSSVVERLIVAGFDSDETPPRRREGHRRVGVEGVGAQPHGRQTAPRA